MKQFLGKIGFVIYLFIVALISLEIIIRLWGYSDAGIYDSIYMPFDKTDEIPYVHKPDLENARAFGLININTDSLGLRSVIPGLRYGPKKPDEYRIAIVGDSVTFGTGVKNTKDTFSQVSEDILNQKQKTVKVKVFNYAAAAYSVKEMAAVLQFRMLDIKPDIVILAIIPGDFDLSRTPSVDKWGYFYNAKISPSVSKNSSIKLMLRKIHSAYFVRDVITRIELGLSQKNDTGLDSSKSRVSRDKIPESYDYIKRFAKIARDNNLKFMVMLIGLAGLKEQWGGVPDQLAEDNIPYYDFSPVYEKLIERHYSRAQLRVSEFDNHPSAIMHREIGKELAEIMFNRFFTTSEPAPLLPGRIVE